LGRHESSEGKTISGPGKTPGEQLKNLKLRKVYGKAKRASNAVQIKGGGKRTATTQTARGWKQPGLTLLKAWKTGTRGGKCARKNRCEQGGTFNHLEKKGGMKPHFSQGKRRGGKAKSLSQKKRKKELKMAYLRGID